MRCRIRVNFFVVAIKVPVHIWTLYIFHDIMIKYDIKSDTRLEAKYLIRNRTAVLLDFAQPYFPNLLAIYEFRIFSVVA